MRGGEEAGAHRQDEKEDAGGATGWRGGRRRNGEVERRRR